MRIFTVILFGFALMLGTFNSNAQTDPQEDLQNEAKKKAMKISQELNLDDDAQMYVFRYVYNEQMQHQKLNQLEKGSEEYETYKTQIEDELRMNLSSQFGEDSVDKIIETYNKMK